jgi:plastocyanin
MRILPLVLIAALLAAAAPAAAATKNVRVDDDYFVRSGSPPPRVTVFKGTWVKWNWRGSRRHNVVVQSGPVRFQSALRRSGSYSRKMRRVGTYRIVCSIHQPDMAMTLRVRRRS